MRALLRPPPRRAREGARRLGDRGRRRERRRGARGARARDRAARVRRGSGRRARRHRLARRPARRHRRTSCTASTRSACRSGSSPTASRSSASCTRRCSTARIAARKGGGAFRDERPHPREQPRRPSRRSSPPASRSGTRICCRGTSPRSAPRCTRFEDLRRVGAASLDLCWTAEGVFDGYFELTPRPLGRRRRRRSSCGRPGGVVTDWDGDPAPGSRAATSWPGRPPCTRCSPGSPQPPSPSIEPIDRARNPRSENHLTRPAAAWSDILASVAMPCPSGNTHSEGARRDDDPHVCNPGQCTGRGRARACRQSRLVPGRPRPRGRRFLGTAMATKHGRPRRTPVSPP